MPATTKAVQTQAQHAHQMVTGLMATWILELALRPSSDPLGWSPSSNPMLTNVRREFWDLLMKLSGLKESDIVGSRVKSTQDEIREEKDNGSGAREIRDFLRSKPLLHALHARLASTTSPADRISSSSYSLQRSISNRELNAFSLVLLQSSRSFRAPLSAP